MVLLGVLDEPTGVGCALRTREHTSHIIIHADHATGSTTDRAPERPRGGEQLPIARAQDLDKAFKAHRLGRADPGRSDNLVIRQCRVLVVDLVAQRDPRDR